MSVTLPTIEPTNFRAGITIAWEKSDFANYSYSEGYTLAYYTITGRNGSKTITGVYASGKWTFTLSAADNDLAAGTYTLFGFVQDASGNKQPVYEGTLEIKASLTTAAQVDTRSDTKKILDALKATMQRRATREQSSTQLPNGVAIALLKPEDLRKEIEYYESLYRRETNGGRAPRHTIAFVSNS